MTVATVQFGKDTRLKVGDGATPEVFSIVAGEGTLTINGASETIDIGSKDDGMTKAQAFGQQTTSIDLAGVVKLPDTGLSALNTAYKTGTPLNIEVVTASTTKFAGSVYVGNRKMDESNGKAANYSFSLTLAAAPTTDAFFG